VLAETVVLIFTNPKVVKFPSMQLLKLPLAASTPEVVGVTAPNKNTAVCPDCAPTPPSLFPVVEGAVAAGVTMLPTKKRQTKLEEAVRNTWISR
jgi:hypothetical protein